MIKDNLENQEILNSDIPIFLIVDDEKLIRDCTANILMKTAFRLHKDIKWTFGLLYQHIMKGFLTF